MDHLVHFLVDLVVSVVHIWPTNTSGTFVPSVYNKDKMCTSKPWYTVMMIRNQSHQLSLWWWKDIS